MRDAPASPSQEKDHRWKQVPQVLPVIAGKARTGSSFPTGSGNSLANAEYINTFSLVIFELNLNQWVYLGKNPHQLSPDGAEWMGKKETSSHVCDTYYSSVSCSEAVGHGRPHCG